MFAVTITITVLMHVGLHPMPKTPPECGTGDSSPYRCEV